MTITVFHFKFDFLVKSIAELNSDKGIKLLNTFAHLADYFSLSLTFATQKCDYS